MTQQKRIDDAVFEIDAHLIQIRDAINLQHAKTQDDELLNIIGLVNLTRQTDALQPKVHGLMSIFTMCLTQSPNHLYKETANLLQQVARGCAEVLKNLIVKE